MSTITDQLGRVLAGRYRLEAGLGTGSSAHVYRAVDTRLGRVVALKLLHPGLGGDEAFLRRFRAEAQAVAALSHPNLVRLFDWGWEDGEAFLVLEYLSGGSLRDLLDEGVLLSAAQAAEVGAQAAAGLAHAHRRGLLHRDVKPANILFDEDGVVRIADFGLARALADAAWTEPIGTVLGTARYASPEQAEGRALDGRSDVYALALVLYEAVTGEVPFSTDTTFGTLMARVGATLPPARALGPLYPVLAQATISDPLARLDASDFALELELLVGQLGRPPRLAVRTAAVREVSPPPRLLYDRLDEEGTELGFPAPANVPAEQPERRVSRRSRTVRWALLGLALVALLLGGGFATLHYVVYGHVVPPLRALSVPAAKARVSQVGLRLGIASETYNGEVPPGKVLSQSLPPGRRLHSGTVIKVVVSKGPAPVPVPHVEALPLASAEQALSAVHLSAVPRSAYSETVPKGAVIVQSPAKGDVRIDGRVIVVASLGPHPRTIPNLGSATWAAAKASLVALRLAPVEVQAYSSTVPSGDVISTSPAEGESNIAVGTRIDVTVSEGPQLVVVPTVSGQLIAAAVAALRAAGLNVTEVVGPPFATQATTTDPAPGTSIVIGSSVTLYTA